MATAISRIALSESFFISNNSASLSNAIFSQSPFKKNSHCSNKTSGAPLTKVISLSLRTLTAENLRVLVKGIESITSSTSSSASFAPKACNKACSVRSAPTNLG